MAEKLKIEYAGKNTVQGIVNGVKKLYEEAGSVSLLLVVKASEGYEGKEITATSLVDGSVYTGTITEGKCLIKVKTPGEYKITNNLNDNTASATVGEVLKDDVYFSEFHATITVTVPEVLIGETITATDGVHTVEAKAESKTVQLTVFYAGSWDVSVKGTEYVQKQTVSVAEEDEDKPCTLSTASGVPFVTVTLAEEFVGQTIVCSKDDVQTKKKSTSETVQFLIKELGEYTIALEESEHIKETVNVNSAKEFKIELTLEDTTVPILIVTSKLEDDGKTIKVSKDSHNFEKVFQNRKVMFVLPEQGVWTISCDDYPEDTKTININANKAFKTPFRASIFGIKTVQAEDDPKTRLVVDVEGDLNGLTPITVNTQDGTVNYGDMPGQFLYDAMNHVVLKSIDKSEEIELNPNDYSKKLEGGNAPAAGLTSNYNQFARVDKLYIYQYDKDGYEYYYISDEKVDDNYTAIGFTKEDDSEADSFYMASYVGSFDDSSRLRSCSGVNIRNYTSYTDFQTAAGKNGTGYSMEQHQMINFYEIAYLMMVQDFNSQTAVGRGRDINGGTSSDHKATQTTGFANNKGPIAYDTESQAIKFMHVEDLWFNSGYSWEEGVIQQNSKVYVRMKPPYISTDAGGTSTYTEVTGATTKSGYISSSVVSNKWGRIPKECNGSETTYECDNFGLNTGSTLQAGGRGNLGLFYRSVDTFSYTSNHYVARLALLP